ncbi:LamG domain-containing protein [Mumia quercus]|uniref:LamG domain-containing protein n=1 Tax=Mumia quercus TaxID=2976125 RepID=UPI0027E26507|nr:LamG domain-containing protein [Mumia quercus]
MVDERSEYSLTFANPDGTFTLEQSVVPQRVERADGSWDRVDATLKVTGSGAVAPKASVLDLELSGGGSKDPLVSMGEGDQRVELVWPTSLPKPTLDGDTATYADVMTDVDLKVTATDTGFREVLVVRSVEGAKAVAAAPLRLGLETAGLEVRPDADGGTRFVDLDGEVVFYTPPAFMWDSSSTEEPARPESKSLSAPPEAFVDDGEEEPHFKGARPGDVLAAITTKASEDAIVVAPRAKDLTSPERVFPIYVDPSVHINRATWMMIGSNGEHDWSFTGDEGMGRCANYCTSGTPYTKRMLFSIPANANLSGRQVTDAKFRITETHAVNCTPTEVRLYRSNQSFSSATRWPGISLDDNLGEKNAAIGWPGGSCAGEGYLTIADNGDSNDNLTGTVRKLANGDFAKLNLVLRAGDESDWNSWKRFRNDATLVVTFYEKPGVPTAIGVRPTSAAAGVCPTSTTNAVTVGEKRPGFTATAQTAVNRPGYGRLRVQFVVERLSGTAWVSQVTQTVPTTTWYGDNQVVPTYMPPSDLPDNAAYRVRMRTLAHNDDSTSALWSGYSANCYFKIDSTGPKAPIVTALTVYSICGVDCAEAGEPGVTGTFRFQPGSGDTNITGYQWQIVGKTGWTNLAGSPVTASVTPATAGTLQLAVQAKDVTGRYGATTAVTFRVKAAPDAEVGTWRVEDAADATELADTSTAGAETHPLTLGAGAATDDRGRRTSDLHPGDRSIRFSGVAGSDATTTGPVIDTAKSFTVGMWAYLENRNGTQVLLSQHVAGASTTNPGLNIYFSTGGWACNFHKKDAAGVTQNFNSASGLSASPVRVWTHVACSYDAVTKTIRIIVNGVPYAPNVRDGVEPLPEGTTGPMTLGRNRDHNATPGGFFTGLIDEVRVWRRTLSPTELKAVANEVQEASEDPDDPNGHIGDGLQATTLVGSWYAGSLTPFVDESSYQRGGFTPFGGATITETGVGLDGLDDRASLAGPVVDDNASFTVSATVRVNMGALAALPDGLYAVTSQKSPASIFGYSWMLGIQKSGGVGSTTAVWVLMRTTESIFPSVISSDTLVGEGDVQVTGVFDAVADKIRLHVGLLSEPEDDDYPATYGVVVKPPAEFVVGAAPYPTPTTGWWGHFPGAVSSLRFWSGAMGQNQLQDIYLVGA